MRRNSVIAELGLDKLPAEAGSDRSASQRQTESTFGFKWHQEQSFNSEFFDKLNADWLLEKYGGGDPKAIDRWLPGEGRVIVDAGCGAGVSGSLLFGARLNSHRYLGIDISSAVEVAAKRFAERGLAGEFVRADIQTVPLPAASVDLILSEGVLHHTDDTGRTIAHLAGALKPGGLFAFYVYRRKGPIREFTDDLLRERLRPMGDREAWDALYPVSKLGQALGRLKVEVDVPEDIPLLGIPKGRIDVQRLFYWHVIKMYYREELSLEEMNHINFDWFRPLNCHRHSEAEVRNFCRDARLDIERLHEQESGYTVVARRN